MCTLIPLVVFSSPIYVDDNNCVVAHAAFWVIEPSVSSEKGIYSSIVYGNRRCSIVSTVETGYPDNEVTTTWFPNYTWVFITNKGALCEILETSTDMRTARPVLRSTHSVIILQGVGAKTRPNNLPHSCADCTEPAELRWLSVTRELSRLCFVCSAPILNGDHWVNEKQNWP